MSIIKEYGKNWREQRCWLKMPEKTMDQFTTYYSRLYKIALKDDKFPDCKFILDNYKAINSPAIEPEVIQKEKVKRKFVFNKDKKRKKQRKPVRWTEEDHHKFLEAAINTGQNWR